MKSYTMKATADHGVIELVDAPLPEVGPHQLLVKVRAAGLNRGEFIVGHGLAKAGSVKPIGMECAGEIADFGAGVTGWRIGQRVMGRCPGAFSEYALMDVREAIAMPEHLSFEEAASVPLAFMVVHDILIAQGRLEAGEWVLVLGVSSGVGVAALQAAKDRGAKVIGTSGSREKLDKLGRWGSSVAICTRGADFHARVLEATDGKGANWWSTRWAARCSPRRSARWPSRPVCAGGLRGQRPHGGDRPAGAARQAPHALRRLEQAAHGRAARLGRPGFTADILPASGPGISSR